MRHFFKKNTNRVLFVLLICFFIFCFSNISSAKSFLESAGGVLWNEIQNFLVWIADSILNLFQNIFITQQDVVIQANSSTQIDGPSIWSVLIILGSIALIIGGVAFAWTGIATPGIMAGIKGVCIGVAMVAGGVVAGSVATNDISEKITGEFDIPMIAYTPFAIFSNTVPAFDINFIGEPIETKKDGNNSNGQLVYDGDDKYYNYEFSVNSYNNYNASWRTFFPTAGSLKSVVISNQVNVNKIIDDFEFYCSELWDSDSDKQGKILWDKKYESATEFVKLINFIGDRKPNNIEENEWNNFIDWANSFIENVLDACKEEAYHGDGAGNKEQIEFESSAAILKPIVSSWYVALRNVSLVGLLSVLVYIGIRILISSTASDKSKYKSMLLDWIVAMCLLFILHYIMVFIVEINTQITKIFTNDPTENIRVILPKDTTIYDGVQNVTLLENAQKDEDFEVDESGNPVLLTNFIGNVRLILGGYTETDMMTSVAYTVIYLVLVIYICIFTFMYLKRVIYMAFLTMIAPLVALTYPIDKLNDGKAQAFNMWVREYIFNALLQPIHLLIYVMLISTVMNMVIDYPVYAIVALGFMIPAEKFIRKMFGFEKAQTPGAFGAVAGTALMMTGMQNLFRKTPSKKSIDKNGQMDSNSKNNESKVRFAENKADMKTALLGSTQEQTEIDLKQKDNNPQLPDPNQNTLNEEVPKLTKGINPETPNSNSNEIKMYQDNVNQVDTKASEKTDEQYQKLTNPMDTKISTTNTPFISKTPIKKKRILNGMGNVAGLVGRTYKRKANQIINNSHPIRFMRKATTATIGATALGTLGLAAGVASGDPSKALQYTATAGVMGGKFASSLGDKVSDDVRIEGMGEEFKRGYYTPEEYQRKQKEKYIKEIQESDRNRTLLGNQGLTRQQIKNIYDDFLPKCLEYNINDIEDIGGAYKLKEKLQSEGQDENEATTKALGAAQLINKYGNSFMTSEKQREDLEKSLGRNEYQGLGSKKDKVVKSTMDLMREFSEQKENGKPIQFIRFKE